MGYYSEVALTLYESDFRRLVKQAKEAGGDFRWLLKEAELFKASVDDKSVVTCHWFYVKWYSEKDLIKKIEDFARSVPAHFIRLGEDLDDIEEWFTTDDSEGFWELAEPRHCIDVEGELKPLDDFGLKGDDDNGLQAQDG